MPNVYLSGVGGLGNCLFQLSAAIYYCEKYKYNLFLIKSPSLLFGTSKMFGRVKCHTDGQEVLTYDKTIFNKLVFIDRLNEICQIIHNDYTENHMVIDENLYISGYNQNLNLFKEVFYAIPRYLNLDDTLIKEYITNKYGDLSSATVIGLRIGSDFSHMTKITPKSYMNALDILGVTNVYVIGDMPSDKFFGSTFKDIEESDIVQLYFGMMCKNYILSESTFHLWIAYLGTDFGKDLTKKVICFNNTDITNRHLELDSWIRMEC